MLKKTITFEDYDGNLRTEDFYFNITRAEAAEMEVSVEGGLVKFVEKAVASQDQKRIVELFKELILKAYGEKSPDGRRHIKNDEVRANFAQTEAYSILFMEIANDAQKAADFFNGIIPNKME